jgi:hypothetical protein
MLLIKDNETTKRVWRFIEQLQQVTDLDDSGEITLTMLDIDDKNELSVKIDREDKKYLSVEICKIQCEVNKYGYIAMHELRQEVDRKYVGFNPQSGKVKPVHIATGAFRVNLVNHSQLRE